ncbi:MAG: response regulator [Polyangiaceae bacterium]
MVDDSAVARARVARELTTSGFEIVLAASLREASACDPTRISAAILDIEIGEDSGIDLARTLRSRAPELPIAFMTATSQSDLVDRAAAFGPVFSKVEEVSDVVRWTRAHATER